MEFSNKLLKWYALHKRDLPWRNTNNPYIIWLSEIILQQTRVKQGLPYFNKFIHEFPAISDLANAPEDKVLKLWQGLGYYSRARNLHASSKIINTQYEGQFPKTYKEIMQLKGIGDYTASAISSFAFGLNYAVVDGNVVRLLSRYFGIDMPFDEPKGKKEFKKLAQELLPKLNAAEHNQAIMEFGALQCTPKSPNCSSCVLEESCMAFSENNVSLYPVKKKKLKIKNRFIHFLIIDSNLQVLLAKRTNGIWKGLYEFPFLEFAIQMDNKDVIASEQWKKIFGHADLNIKSVSPSFTHRLSHQKIEAIFWQVKINKFNLEGYDFIAIDNLGSFPISRLLEKYLLSVGIL